VALLALAVMSGPLLIQGADWPQWGGPAGDGNSPEKGLIQAFPDGGPPLVWTFGNAGTGYTAPVVVKGNVYLLGAREGIEYIIALDSKGKELWATKIDKMYDFDGNSFSGGPNASPAIRGEYLVGLGSQGELVCVDPAKGQERWRTSLPTKLGGVVNPVGGGPGGWGFSAAPLIDGDQVIVTPGGKKGLVAALDLKKGNLLWQSAGTTEETTYAAPVLAEIAGVKMVIAMTQNGAVGVSTKDGTVLWVHKRTEDWPDVVCTSPLVHGNQVFLSVGHGGGAEMLELTNNGGKFAVKVVWSKKEIGNRQGGVVLVDKHIYGYHENRSWMCQDWAKGDEAWSSPRAPRGLGAGSLIYADGNLICLTEDKSEVALLDASPAGYKEKGKFTLPKKSALRKSRGRVWTHPVLSDGLLYLRDQELLFCYNLKK
jgi:outer membrane protein assembly factor BamB